MLRRHALERRRQLRRTLVQTPHRRRDVLRQRPPVRRADRARLVARAPRRQRHRHVTVRVRLDLDLPHDLPVLAAHRAFPCAARRIAAYGAHRRHFAALDFHAVRAHVLRRLAERHPDLDRLRPVVLIWRRREPRPQRHPHALQLTGQKLLEFNPVGAHTVRPRVGARRRSDVDLKRLLRPGKSTQVDDEGLEFFAVSARLAVFCADLRLGHAVHPRLAHVVIGVLRRRICALDPRRRGRDVIRLAAPDPDAIRLARLHCDFGPVNVAVGVQYRT